MTIFTNKNIILLTKVLLSVLIVGLGIGMAQAGIEHDEGTLGNPPTPPGGIFPPINLSSFLQVKEGGVSANNFESVGYLWAGQLISFGNALLGNDDSLVEIGGIVSPGDPANAELLVSGAMAIHRTNPSNGTLKASNLKNIFIDINDATICATQTGQVKLCDDNIQFNVVVSRDKTNVPADDFDPANVTWTATSNVEGDIVCDRFVNASSNPIAPENVQSNWSAQGEPASNGVPQVTPVYTPDSLWYTSGGGGGTGTVIYKAFCRLTSIPDGDTLATAIDYKNITYGRPDITVNAISNGDTAELKLIQTGLNYGNHLGYQEPPSNWER
ncbi:MAG: hypothetical protein ACI83D_000691, partial [Planctomycetota bacterium]